MKRNAIALLAVCGLCGIAASPAAAFVVTYTFNGSVSAIGGSGDVLGVPGSPGDPVSGTITLDMSDAFIVSSSGVQASSLFGPPSSTMVALNGHTVAALVYQCTEWQQSSAGINSVEIFPVGNSMLVDGSPIGNFGSFYLHLAFASPTPLPNGTLPDLTTLVLDPTLSFGRMLEFNGGGSDSIDFSIDTILPAPGAAYAMIGAGLLGARRRRV